MSMDSFSFFWWSVVHVLIYSIIHYSTPVRALDCVRSKQEWLRVRYTSVRGNQPLVSGTGYSMGLCPVPAESCCDKQMEADMYALSQRHFLQQANVNWLPVAEQMSNDSVALEYFFRSDLEQAKNRLHQFFSRIYGYNYKLNHGFFFQFFTDLEAYISGQRNHLDHLIENFFNQLRDNIVSLIERSTQGRTGSISSDLGPASASVSQSSPASRSNLGGSSSSEEATETRRLRCLSDRVAQLRPFDDVDVRLKARMLEAYPPARMLVNVLSTSSRLLSQLATQVTHRPECVAGMARFQFCAVCAGKPLRSVCQASCVKLMSSCLHVSGAETAQMVAIWPRLIDAIVMATVRLERSFNFPAVNRHLQMEISEAITSLQTRYEQTKTKFESECRAGFSGRGMPTLFSSSGSQNRPLPSGGHTPAFGGWPPSLRGSRWKRDISAQWPRNTRQRNPSYSSPELLDWQMRTHPQGPAVGGIGMDSGPNAYSPQQAYRQPMDFAPKPAWDTGSDDSVSDVPERLMRWASQLKRTYTSLGNFFAVPGANFCPANSMPFKANDTNSTNCWSPPDLTNVNPDERVTETLQLLSEAAERLHQASSNNGDPDALVMQLPDTRQPSLRGYVSTLHSPPTGLSYPTAAAAEDMQHFPEQNQWEPPLPRSAQFESMENPEGPNGMLTGSGVEEHNWDGVPPGNQPQAAHPSESPIDFRKVPIPRPLPTTLSPSYVVPDRQPVDNFPLEGSAYEENQSPYEVPSEDQWSPKQPDARNTLNRDSIEGADQYKPATLMFEPAGQASSASTSSMPTTQTTYPTTTTEEPTKTSEPTTFTSTTMLTTTVVATTRITTPVVIPHTRNWRFQESSKEVSTTQLPTTTEATTISTTGSSTQQPKWSFKPITHYGVLPDDEDSLISPENTQPPSTSAPASFKEPSWSGSSKPEQEASWWESSYTEGSGLPVESQGSNTQFHMPAYSENNYHLRPDKPTVSTPQGAPGSGQLPFQGEPDQGSREARPAYNVPPVGAQEPPRSMPFENQPPNWVDPPRSPSQSYSASPGSGMVDGVWLGGRSDESRGDDMWQENSLGSGASKPMEYQPTHVERPPSPPISVVPQPPVVAPPIVHPPSAMPYQPMPPPEIWVPAQLGPGQPAAPVLFVREYQVQGPFYSPDAMQTKLNRAAVHAPLWNSLAIAMLHARFAYL
ncbi:hypothetical protein P879_07178 [Paragonimus westermani]|uniref:Glypican n=1 Tax=Paragonimus westermani TaxID=34504 RepID=A0A8T0DBB3_9TREM|nr:hypothetical protein P879_07178 [Paragonimus westermani]